MGENELFCYTCSIGFSSVLNLKEHNLSLMHHKVYDHQMKNNGQKQPRYHECFICNKRMMLDSWESHIRSSRHKQQLKLMRTAILSNKAWTPPALAPTTPRGDGHDRRRGYGHRNCKNSNTPAPAFGGATWAMPIPPLPFRPWSPGNWPRADFRQWGPQSFHPPFMGPRNRLPNNESFNSYLINGDRREGEGGDITSGETTVGKSKDGGAPGSKEEKRQSFDNKIDKQNENKGCTGVNEIELDALLERAQAMQDEFRNQREEAKVRMEAKKKEEARQPMKDVEAKLKAANESNAKKIKGLIERSKADSTVRPVIEEAPRVSALTSPVKASSEAKTAVGNDRQTLLNMVSMPRSRRERRQVEDIIKKTAQRRVSRPRLKPQTSSTEAETENDTNQESDTLSATIMDVILRHEKGDTDELPTIDLNLEDVTSAVTSLTNTARVEAAPQTTRSEDSSVCPAAKKRKTDGSSAEDPVAGATEMEMTQSEEVTRMQRALELSVKEDGMKKKIMELDALIEEQRMIMNSVIQRIEELEAQKSEIRLQEREVYEQRMEILKESYSQVVEASRSSVSESTEISVVDSSVPSSSVSSSRPTVKQEMSGTPSYSVEIEDEEEVEEESESTPLIGNMTAREIRERAMAIIEGGAMSFGDLDDVLNELMRVSNTPDHLTTEVDTAEEEVTQKSSQKRRRKKSQEDAPDTSACDKNPVPAPESVVSDVLSSRTSPRKGGKSRNSHSDSSPISSDGQTVASSVASIPPIAAFPGAIEAHKGVVHEVQIFRGHVYTAGDDGRVRRFNPQSHECVMEYLGHRKAVRCLFVTEKPTGKTRVFSGGAEKLMIVHDMKTGEELQRLAMVAQIHCMYLYWFSLYLGLSNGMIVTYDVRKNRVIFSKKISSSEIRSLQPWREGARRVLVVATADGCISVRNVCNGNLMHTVGQVEKPLDTLRARVLQSFVFTIAGAGKLREFSIMGNSVKKPRKVGAKVTSLFVQPNEDFLLLGCQDGSVRIADSPEDNSTLIKVFYTAKRTSITSVACQAHEKGSGTIFAGNKDGSIFIIRFTTTTKQCKIPGCILSFEFDDDLIYHVTRDHILKSDGSDLRCMWNGCKHRHSKLDSEAMEMHIRSHL